MTTPSIEPERSFTQWERIPKERLDDHVQFYHTARRDHTAQHWAFELMVTTLQSFYQRSGGLAPLNIRELDHFWKTGNIPTRNLHLLKPKSISDYLVSKSSLSSSSLPRCALCSNTFLPNDLCYELPCGDCFHVTHNNAENTDELKCHLQCNNDCPHCNTRIHFEEARTNAG